MSLPSTETPPGPKALTSTDTAASTMTPVKTCCSVGSSGSLGPVPFPIVVFALAVIVATIVLRKTVFGRELYAVGGNEEAARLSGVATDRHRLVVYLFSGLLSGLASLLLMAFTQTADPNAAKGYELQSIAAVVVGGTPLSGGVAPH